MDIVNYKNIESASYNNILEMMGKNVSDPRGVSRNMFYDTDPLAKSFSFGDFPYIVVEHPLVDYEGVSADGKSKNVEWTMRITLRTVRDGSGNSAVNKGSSDLLSMGDALNVTFNSLANRKVFALNNMYFIKLVKNSFTSPVIDQNYLYENRYTLTFMTRMEVSL